MAALNSSSVAPPPSDQQQLQRRQISTIPNPDSPATNRSVGGGGVSMMTNSPQQPQSPTTRPVIPQPQHPPPPQYHPHPVFGVPAPPSPPRFASLPLHPSPPPPPPPHHHQQQQQGILYPVASSGRGFIPKPTLRPNLSPDQAAAAGFPPRPLYHHVRAFGFLPSSSQDTHVYLMRQSRSPMHHLASASTSTGPIKGLPVAVHPKIGSTSASVLGSNGIKHPRNRSKDDILSTIRDRKVKISDGMSLYALCRSWLRNGVPEETQYPDIMHPLPRPFPVAPLEAVSPNKKENEEDEGAIGHVSAQELLYRHIKRAKRVRARLRDERLQRIGRYKARLALLLPPVVEQFRNDAVAGN